jgi:transcriptional regulator with XRE-family HTH domain
VDQQSADRQDEPTRAPARTLADKLDRLFRTAYPKGRGPYSYEEAAEAIAQATGEKISANTLWRYRTGKHDNPTMRTIEALAKFFRVPPAYFFDDEVSDRIGEQVEALALIRDGNLGPGQLRSLGEMSDAGRRAIAEMIQAVARMEASAKDKGGN